MIGRLAIFTALLAATAAGARTLPRASPVQRPVTPAQQHALQAGFINGVALGGLFVMETSWMWDQFNAGAELDWVTQLRNKYNDSFAIQTMKNHWAGYIPEAAIQDLAAFGITHVRIPVSYFTFEAPIDPPGSTAYDFGFNHEGFVTGGLNYLEDMLAILKANNMKALIDLHAPPGGGSRCASYSGILAPDADASFWNGSPPNDNTTQLPACPGGGPYYSSRGSKQTWMQVGETILKGIAHWIVGLESDSRYSGVVFGLEVVNEPALGFPNQQDRIYQLLEDVVPSLQQILSAGSSAIVYLNFIGPNDNNAGQWLAQQIGNKTFGALNIDYHYYLNWAGSLSMQQLLSHVCGASGPSASWYQYTSNNLPTVVGEWSTASNLDNPSFTNISLPVVQQFLGTFWANQMSLFASSNLTVGNFYWTARMGSGWDPRPTASSPSGQQVPGTTYYSSLPSFHYRDWNLLELIHYKIIKPINQLNIQGICKCNGCSTTWPPSAAKLSAE